jgi:hypothetical protein
MDNAFLIKHLEQAQEHLRAMLDRHSQLETEQRDLEREIAKLTQDIAQLHEMCGEIPKDTESAKLSANIKEWGLTDAIRIVMKAADRALSAVDIRDRLKSIGFNTGQYQNDMATVSLTLQRMVKQGEIDPTVKKVNGKTLYIWSPIGPNVNEIEIAFVNPPYAKGKERRHRVSPDPELIRQMMKKKSSKLELKKRK